MICRTIGGMLAASVMLLATGCAGTGSGSSNDSTTAQKFPSEVSTVGLVLEKDGTPMLCLGAIDSSYPPQCSGLDVAGWDWEAVEGEESALGVTWGSYAVWGSWDGSTFTVTREPVLAALYDPIVDPMVPDPLDDSLPPGAIPESEFERVWAELQDILPPDLVLLGYANGRVTVTVLFDDGALQSALDERYGDDAVVVISAFTPVDED